MSLESKPWGLPYIASPVFFQVLTTSSPIYIPPFTPMNYQFFLNFLGLQNMDGSMILMSIENIEKNVESE